ncbi:MAG: hypothetical protein N2439_15665, partial [Anaerolineae bacterium]|nr:hypothetical protein [Anaerolineae bacterium]
MSRWRHLARGLTGFLVALTMLVAPSGAAADAPGDYRSKATGNWGDATTWQVFIGTKWVDASTAPTSAAGIITVRNGHTITITADVSVDQVVIEAGAQLTIGSSSTMTLTNGSGTDLTVAGTLLNQGTFVRAAYATWAVSAGGVYIHNTRAAVSDLLGSAVALDASSTFVYRGSSSLNPPVSISEQTYGNLTFASTSGSWTPTLSGNKTLTVKGSFTIGKDVTFNAITGRFTGPITVKGNWTNDGTFNADPATGTVTFDGIALQTIGGLAPTAFNNLTISNTKSPGVTLAQDIAVNGALTIAAGATFSANSYTITAAGDWTNHGTFNAGTGKVLFNRAGTSLIGGSNATTFYDLEIGPHTTLDVAENPLFDATSSVRNYGRLTQTKTVGTDNVAFLNLASGTYRGVEIDPSDATPLGRVTVTIYGEQNCPAPPVLGVPAIKRCFEIAPTTATAATVRFWYDAANELNGNTPGKEKVYHQACLL